MLENDSEGMTPGLEELKGRFGRRLDELHTWHFNRGMFEYFPPEFDDADDLIEAVRADTIEALTAIEQLEARIAEKDAALAPFAAMAEYAVEMEDDDRRDAVYCGGSPGLRCEVTIADYLRARQALERKPDVASN